MSYGMGFALQQAVFGVLSTDQAVTALVGDAVFDAGPAGEVPALYVQLGAEAVRDASDGTGGGAEHRFTVLIVTYHAGFAPAKQVAAAVSDVLIGGQFALSRGHLVSLTFERAVARQVGAEARRQIEMRFKARVQDG
jgi:hypothetical protein